MDAVSKWKVFFIFNSLRTTKAKKFGFRGIFSHNTPTDFAKSVNEDMRRYGFSRSF